MHPWRRTQAALLVSGMLPVRTSSMVHTVQGSMESPVQCELKMKVGDPLVPQPLIPGTVSGTLARRLQGLVHTTKSLMAWWAREHACQRATTTQSANLLITLWTNSKLILVVSSRRARPQRLQQPVRSRHSRLALATRMARNLACSRLRVQRIAAPNAVPSRMASNVASTSRLSVQAISAG